MLFLLFLPLFILLLLCFFFSFFFCWIFLQNFHGKLREKEWVVIGIYLLLLLLLKVLFYLFFLLNTIFNFGSFFYLHCVVSCLLFSPNWHIGNIYLHVYFIIYFLHFILIFCCCIVFYFSQFKVCGCNDCIRKKIWRIEVFLFL